MTAAIKKLKAKTRSRSELHRLTAMFNASPMVVTKPIEKCLERFDPVSAEILRRWVLEYVSMARPTITHVYRCYQANIALMNCEQRPYATALPTLSKYVFRSAIDSLDPFFVMAGRYGVDAAMRHLRRQLPKYSKLSHQALPPLALAT